MADCLEGLFGKTQTISIGQESVVMVLYVIVRDPFRFHNSNGEKLGKGLRECKARGYPMAAVLGYSEKDPCFGFARITNFSRKTLRFIPSCTSNFKRLLGCHHPWTNDVSNVLCRTQSSFR